MQSEADDGSGDVESNSPCTVDGADDCAEPRVKATRYAGVDIVEEYSVVVIESPPHAAVSDEIIAGRTAEFADNRSVHAERSGFDDVTETDERGSDAIVNVAMTTAAAVVRNSDGSEGVSVREPSEPRQPTETIVVADDVAMREEPVNEMHNKTLPPRDNLACCLAVCEHADNALVGENIDKPTGNSHDSKKTNLSTAANYSKCPLEIARAAATEFASSENFLKGCKWYNEIKYYDFLGGLLF